MSTRGVTPGELERFRIALEAAVARSSLRAVAQSVGMSPTGLSKLLDGAQPYGKTVERLHRWISRHAGLNRIPSERIADQLRQTVATLPDPDTGVAKVLEAVEHAYTAEGMLPPEWVKRVRAVVRSPETRGAPR